MQVSRGALLFSLRSLVTCSKIFIDTYLFGTLSWFYVNLSLRA